MSSKQFKNAYILQEIDEVMERTGLTSNNLKLEITETSLIDRSQETIKLLKQLKQRNLEIIQSIIHLAHNLGMNVVAEGIETEEQLIYLQKLNCDFGQGYLFNRPLTAQETENLLRDGC